MQLALCIWGDTANSSDQIDRVSNAIISCAGIKPLVFSNRNNDIHYSLWLANNNKRQYEIEHQRLFTGVLYVNSEGIDTVQPQNLVTTTPDKHTIYYHHDYELIFYSDSLAGDYASLYSFNRGNRGMFANDWQYHLCSYRLNLRKLVQ